jgi:hypothetical protein
MLFSLLLLQKMIFVSNTFSETILTLLASFFLTDCCSCQSLPQNMHLPIQGYEFVQAEAHHHKNISWPLRCVTVTVTAVGGQTEESENARK